MGVICELASVIYPRFPVLDALALDDTYYPADTRLFLHTFT